MRDFGGFVLRRRRYPTVEERERILFSHLAPGFSVSLSFLSSLSGSRNVGCPRLIKDTHTSENTVNITYTDRQTIQ